MSKFGFRYIAYFVCACCLVLQALALPLPDFAHAVDGLEPVYSDSVVEGRAGNTPDPAKRLLLNFFSAINGRPGDLFVMGSAIGCLLGLWKRRYRLAVGFLILISGLVILRVVISVFFGTRL